MKIQCPKCHATYNIDDSKIPQGGGYVRCKQCQNRFHIEKPSDDIDLEIEEPAAEIGKEATTQSLITDEDYTIFIGKNAYKYLQKFKKFNMNGIDRFSVTWHWPAFFITFFWMLYRKLYLWAFLSLLIGFLLGMIPFFGFLLCMIFFGLTGNYIYYKHINKKILELKQLKVSPDVLKVQFVRGGGVNSIALVIAPILIIFVVGILAAIAIPQFSAYRMRSYNSIARTDLINATVAQEAYYVDNETYADSIERLIGSTYGLYLSEGVRVNIQYANTKHYRMVASHEKGEKKYIILGPVGDIHEENM